MLYAVLIALALNLVTFLAFGWDKRSARLSRRRTPEARLLGLAFLGGFVGAWAGAHSFRHKTQKVSFRLKLAAVTVFNPIWPLLWLWWTRPGSGDL